MVVGAFPVAKLGALLLKQVSKPLANAVKSRAKKSPFFRTYICMPPAQFYHWAEVKMKMWSMNLGKPVNIPKLNEAMAIDLGAELLGEGIIFIIAAGILIAEYVRSSNKEKAKEDALTAELNRVQNDLRTLYLETAHQEAHIRELVRILNISLPEAKYCPKPLDSSSIPEHHRLEHYEEEEETLFSSLKGWVWSAIDFILPEVEDTGNKGQGAQGKATNNTVSVSTPSGSGNVKPSNSQDVSCYNKDSSGRPIPMPTARGTLEIAPLELANPSSVQNSKNLEVQDKNVNPSPPKR